MAHHHESNGHAEVGVGEMKNLLAKTKTYKAFTHALREWRNTPRYGALSPSQWLTCHHQRTEVVAAPEAYRRISDTELKEHEDQRWHRLEKEKARVDQSSGILEPMKPGDSVLVQDPKTSRWSMEATVVSRRNKRSYNIEIDGRHHIPNRRLLKPVIAPKEIAPKEITPKEIGPKYNAPKENAPKETNTKETYPEEMDTKETAPKETAPKETRSNKKKNKLHVKEHNLRPCHNGTMFCSVIEIQVYKAHPNLGEVM